MSSIVMVSSAAIILALFLRFLPCWVGSGVVGVDHWFWKLYIETNLRDKTFPPVLSQYVLDEYQWYPPLFQLVIAKLPKSVLDRYSYIVAIVIDLIRMMFLLVVISWITNGNLLAIGTAGLIYATTPLLISYNVQLNPRGLGAILLDLAIVLFVWVYLFKASVWIWSIIILLSGMILLTHKMTTQVFWFLCLTAGLMASDWRGIVLIPISVVTALMISRGFYWKVMRAHWDIVSFWNRNWRWLQAHPVKESPIYGEKDYETPTKFHQKGFRGFVRHLFYLFAYNPAAWLLCLVFIFNSHVVSIGPKVFIWANWWFILILVFAIITVFVPFLKCLGSGYLYLYNAAFPSALLWGITMSKSDTKIYFFIIFLTALILSFLSISFFYRNLKSSRTQKIDSDLEKVIHYLKDAPKGTVMCLPPQWYDVIAYKTGKEVLYGGHGYGFKLLEPVFPRLLLPMREIVRRYNVRYLITIESYLPENFVSDLTHKTLVNLGLYRIFLLGD
jgi:hypothetical protein